MIKVTKKNKIHDKTLLKIKTAQSKNQYDFKL